MNKDRKKEIDKCIETLNKGVGMLEDLETTYESVLSSVRDEIEGIPIEDAKNAEEGELDELSEAAQEGDKGTAMQEAVERLGEADESVSEFFEKLEEAEVVIDGLKSKLNEAVELLKQAKGEEE